MNKGEYIEYFYNQLKEYQIHIFIIKKQATYYQETKNVFGMCVCLQKKMALLELYIHLLPSMCRQWRSLI